MKKSVIAMICVLSAAIFVGCSGGSSGSSSTQTTTAATTEATTAATTKATTKTTTSYSSKTSSSKTGKSSSGSSKKTCPGCHGQGRVQQYYTNDPSEAPHWETCWACKGTGEI